MEIPQQMAIDVIVATKKLLETAPPLVNAANHVVQNGIRQGGYDIMTSAWRGIAQNSDSIRSLQDVGTAAHQGLAETFKGSGNLMTDVTQLGKNVKNRFVAAKPAPTVPQLGTADAFEAVDKLNHAVSETASGASSAIGAVGSAAAKGGLAGIALGITAETLASYSKYKNGELTKDEYIKEIAKSGGQMGITGAATSGIMMMLKVPLSAAAPVTVPISIVLGAAIDKVVAPAFGRGDYAKLLGEAKYYQNLMYAHDDLVQAIGMCEQQFAEFAEEYARQMQVHAMLTDQNAQVNQLHTVANARLQQQANDTKASLNALGDLFDQI